MPVSVIIPTYNGVDLLKKHLPSVLKALRQHDEIVIVDDCSIDSTVPWLTQIFDLETTTCSVKDTFCFKGIQKDIDVKVLVNQTNQRFASSCNRGVEIAKSEIVILLNNDVSPEKDFLKYLLPHFKDKKVFAVGCKELAANEKNKEYGRNEAHFERGFLVHNRAEFQNEQETFWASGGSSAFRRIMWLRLKGFDLDYRPAYWEDIDLSYRARCKGWKIAFEPKATVHHIHESTNTSVFGKGKMEVMAYKNSILFVWKNANGIEMIQHFVWLPYHLIFTTIRSQGRFFIGFLVALKQAIFKPFQAFFPPLSS